MFVLRHLFYGRSNANDTNTKIQREQIKKEDENKQRIIRKKMRGKFSLHKTDHIYQRKKRNIVNGKPSKNLIFSCFPIVSSFFFSQMFSKELIDFVFFLRCLKKFYLILRIWDQLIHSSHGHKECHLWAPFYR